MSEILEDVTYSVIFKNNSSNEGYVCIFQADPEIGPPDVFSLAWLTQYNYPNTQVKFDWKINYNFVWAQTGELVPGVIFAASQTVDANLTDQNQITLTYNKAYHFLTPATQGPAGSLLIVEDGTIPLKEASVGIGMSGKGTFVVPTQPNYHVTFTPHPHYWIAFGDYEEGKVLDITKVTNKQEIGFDPGVHSMAAILGLDNSWTIKPTSEVNARFIKARAINENAIWGDNL